jgi:hypothetical protein
MSRQQEPTRPPRERYLPLEELLNVDTRVCEPNGGTSIGKSTSKSLVRLVGRA